MSKKEVEKKAEEVNDKIEEIKENIEKQRKDRRDKRMAQSLARRQVNDVQSTEAYENLSEARVELRKVHRKLIPQEAQLRELRRELYAWNKLHTAPALSASTSNTPAIKMTIPTWEHSSVEDDVQHMDISNLQANSRGKRRILVFAGTDYGIVKMSQTVALSQAQIG
ncbi:hypothetical protein BGX27_005915, partial [Mortierella sp. AM989]